MLYSEFIEGTGCKDTENNYKVYKNLEIMYMNSDMSKSDIYEYGKKLVDNSKTKEELKIESDVKEEIAELKDLIQRRKEDIERLKMYLNECDNTADEERWMKETVKNYNEAIKHYRSRISALKWVLA